MMIQSENSMSSILEDQRNKAMTEESTKSSEYVNAKPVEIRNVRRSSTSILFWSWSNEKVNYTYDDTPVKNAQSSYETAKRIAEILGDKVRVLNDRKKGLEEHKNSLLDALRIKIGERNLVEEKYKNLVSPLEEQISKKQKLVDSYMKIIEDTFEETGVIEEHMSGYIKSTMNLLPGAIQAVTDVSKVNAGLNSFSSILKQNFLERILTIEEVLALPSYTVLLPQVNVFKELGLDNHTQFALFKGDKETIEEFVKEFESRTRINVMQKLTLKRMFEVVGQNENDTNKKRSVTIEMIVDFSLFMGRLQPVCMQLLDDQVQINKKMIQDKEINDT